MRSSYTLAVLLLLAASSSSSSFEYGEARARRHIDDNNHRRGRKHYDAKEDGFFDDYGYDKGLYHGEKSSDHADIRSNVPGEPGLDYPAFLRVPRTNFSCYGKEQGYYADQDAGCQVFHVCDEGLVSSQLCPIGTLFHQRLLTCDWWTKVPCSQSHEFYKLQHQKNVQVYQEWVPHERHHQHESRDYERQHHYDGSYQEKDYEKQYDDGSYYQDKYDVRNVRVQERHPTYSEEEVPVKEPTKKPTFAEKKVEYVKNPFFTKRRKEDVPPVQSTTADSNIVNIQVYNPTARTSKQHSERKQPLHVKSHVPLQRGFTTTSTTTSTTAAPVVTTAAEVDSYSTTPVYETSTHEYHDMEGKDSVSFVQSEKERALDRAELMTESASTTIATDGTTTSDLTTEQYESIRTEENVNAIHSRAEKTIYFKEATTTVSSFEDFSTTASRDATTTEVPTTTDHVEATTLRRTQDVRKVSGFRINVADSTTTRVYDSSTTEHPLTTTEITNEETTTVIPVKDTASESNSPFEITLTLNEADGQVGVKAQSPIGVDVLNELISKHENQPVVLDEIVKSEPQNMEETPAPVQQQHHHVDQSGPGFRNYQNYRNLQDQRVNRQRFRQQRPKSTTPNPYLPQNEEVHNVVSITTQQPKVFRQRVRPQQPLVESRHQPVQQEENVTYLPEKQEIHNAVSITTQRPKLFRQRGRPQQQQPVENVNVRHQPVYQQEENVAPSAEQEAVHVSITTPQPKVHRQRYRPQQHSVENTRVRSQQAVQQEENVNVNENARPNPRQRYHVRRPVNRQSFRVNQSPEIDARNFEDQPGDYGKPVVNAMRDPKSYNVYPKMTVDEEGEEPMYLETYPNEPVVPQYVQRQMPEDFDDYHVNYQTHHYPENFPADYVDPQQNQQNYEQQNTYQNPAVNQGFRTQPQQNNVNVQNYEDYQGYDNADELAQAQFEAFGSRLSTNNQQQQLHRNRVHGPTERPKVTEHPHVINSGLQGKEGSNVLYTMMQLAKIDPRPRPFAPNNNDFNKPEDIVPAKPQNIDPNYDQREADEEQVYDGVDASPVPQNEDAQDENVKAYQKQPTLVPRPQLNETSNARQQKIVNYETEPQVQQQFNLPADTNSVPFDDNQRYIPHSQQQFNELINQVPVQNVPVVGDVQPQPAVDYDLQPNVAPSIADDVPPQVFTNRPTNYNVRRPVIQRRPLIRRPSTTPPTYDEVPAHSFENEPVQPSQPTVGLQTNLQYHRVHGSHVRHHPSELNNQYSSRPQQVVRRRPTHARRPTEEFRPTAPTTTTAHVEPDVTKTPSSSPATVETEVIPSLSFDLNSEQERKEYYDAVEKGLVHDESDSSSAASEKDATKADKPKCEDDEEKTDDKVMNNFKDVKEIMKQTE